MRNLQEFRAGKAASYPDQAVYAAYASAEFGLGFDDIDGGTGLAFRVASPTKTAYFGAGRCSWYPQNNATAAMLASDKYFASRILEDAGITTLGGNYYFLSTRHRALRPAGHERDDVTALIFPAADGCNRHWSKDRRYDISPLPAAAKAFHPVN